MFIVEFILTINPRFSQIVQSIMNQFYKILQATF